MKSFVVLVFLLLTSSSAFAYTFSTTDTGHVIRWYNNDPTFTLQVDADGPNKKRAGTTLADINGAIDRAVASWNSISCNAATLVIDPTRTLETANVVTNSESTDNLDQINRVVWIEDQAEYKLDANVLGVTSAIFYEDGTIIEADIALNGAGDTWAVFDSVAESESAGSNVADVESVLVHEIGHLLGLAHVLNGQVSADPPTMSPVVDPGLRTRSLSADDTAAICLLYPASTFTCSGDSECPRFITSNGNSDGGSEQYNSIVSQCSAGTCTNIETVPCGGGNLGERCCTDNCTGSLFCLALSQTTNMAYCASTCSTSSKNCPSGFTCVALSGGGTNGACITEAVTGCACDTNNTCTSSCACDTDCGTNGGSGPSGSTDGGCSQVGGIWAALACAALMTRRVRLL